MIGPLILFLISLAGGIFWLYKIIKGNSSPSGGGHQTEPHEEADHEEEHDGHGEEAHAHHPPTTWQVFQFITGGLIIWYDWGGGCDKAGKFWPRLMMVVFCLINILFWRNTGIVFLVLWIILTIIFIWLAIAGRKGSNPADWHIHAHYWEDGIEWVLGTVISWCFLASISWLFLTVVQNEERKESVQKVALAKTRVAKTKATFWTWKHTSPWVKNSQTKNLVWEEGPNGKVVFQSPLTTGEVVTVSYSAGSDEGVYQDTKDPNYRGVVKPLGNLKAGIPSFEGKSQAIAFGLFEKGKFEGTITFTPVEQK